MPETMRVDHQDAGRRLSPRSDRGRGAAPQTSWSTRLHPAGTDDRHEVEAYLERAYARAFDGRIRRHYPTLMSVRDAHGAIQAAVGFRFAHQEPLFLEQYLDVPVELAVERTLGRRPQRPQICEIGNLAADSHAASLSLFVTLAAHLARQGCTHAVATATRQLRRRFRRIGVATQSLTRAEPARLASGAGDWGAYYARDPEVIAGAITQPLPPPTQDMEATR